jgi:hypothetical protein
VDKLKVKKTIFKYKKHTEWDSLTDNKEAYTVFETWYNAYKQDFKHIKHAFNHLCKHYKIIKIAKHSIKCESVLVTHLWSLSSFNDGKKSKAWIYQDNKLIATKFWDGELLLKDHSIASFKSVIAKCSS